MLPDYQAFMRPLVDALRSKEAATLDELRDEVSGSMGLDDGARTERMKWDGRLVLDHRLETAAETLDHAGLLAREGERWTLTPTGRGELPETLDREALMIFPDFARYMEDFRSRRGA